MSWKHTCPNCGTRLAVRYRVHAVKIGSGSVPGNNMIAFLNMKFEGRKTSAELLKQFPHMSKKQIASCAWQMISKGFWKRVSRGVYEMEKKNNFSLDNELEVCNS